MLPLVAPLITLRMKRLFFTLSLVVLSVMSIAQTREELYDRFNDSISKRDSTAIALLIKDWEKLYPDDAELYSVRANYYYQGAVQELIVMSDTAPTDGRPYYEVLDSVGVRSYMYPETIIDSLKLDSAKKVLAEGIRKNPDRIDLRLGKVAMHLSAKENVAAVMDIQSALVRSLKNNNKWTGTLDKAVESDGVSYLRDCIQDYLAQLLDAGDLASAEKISDICIKCYPEDAVFLTNKGVVRSYTGDQKAALEWFLKAREVSPGDMLITYNIASMYLRQGDEKKALVYFRIVAEGDDEQFAEIARTAIQELTEE